MNMFKKIKSSLEDVFIIIVGLGILIGIGWLILWFGKIVWKEITKPAPTCYWKYVDTKGNEGTAKECLNSWGKLYCGTDNKAWAVTSIERICE